MKCEKCGKEILVGESKICDECKKELLNGIRDDYEKEILNNIREDNEKEKNDASKTSIKIENEEKNDIIHSLLKLFFIISLFYYIYWIFFIIDGCIKGVTFWPGSDSKNYGLDALPLMLVGFVAYTFQTEYVVIPIYQIIYLIYSRIHSSKSKNKKK